MFRQKHYTRFFGGNNFFFWAKHKVDLEIFNFILSLTSFISFLTGCTFI